MKTITAKFASRCHATGERIKKGELIDYDPVNKKAYKLGKGPQETEEQRDADNVRGYVQAQEDAYFDNLWNGMGGR